MFRGGVELTAAEKEAVYAEAERIAQLGDEWKPTPEALCEVLLAAKKAGRDEHNELRLRGIEAARKRGTTIGRPRKKPPSNFSDFIEDMENGELTRADAARILGVSKSTLYQWVHDWYEQ